MEKLGMGFAPVVSNGSRQPPKLITLEHRGGPKQQKPVVTGRQRHHVRHRRDFAQACAEMDEMKYDMSGAGSVLAP